MASTKDEQLSLLDTSSSALSVYTKGNVIFRSKLIAKQSTPKDSSVINTNETLHI